MSHSNTNTPSQASVQTADVNRKRKFVSDEEDKPKKLTQTEQFRRALQFFTRDPYYVSMYSALLELTPIATSGVLIIIEYMYDGVFAAYASGATTTVLLEEGFETPSWMSPTALVSHCFNRGEDQSMCCSVASTEGLFLYIPCGVRAHEVFRFPIQQLSTFDQFQHAVFSENNSVAYEYATFTNFHRLDNHKWNNANVDVEEYEQILDTQMEHTDNMKYLLASVISRSGSNPPRHFGLFRDVLRQQWDFMCYIIGDFTEIRLANPHTRDALRVAINSSYDLFSRFERTRPCSDNKAACYPESLSKVRCGCRENIAHAKSLAFACVREIDKSFCLDDAIDSHEQDQVEEEEEEEEEMTIAVVERLCSHRSSALAWLMNHDLTIACECWRLSDPAKVCPCQ
jgi:hypothetical protein